MAEPSGPFQSGRAGCGGYRPHPMLSDQPCHNLPVWAGLMYFPYPLPGVAAWEFTCDDHRPFLTAPRRLNDRDRAELARRREKKRRARTGEGPWVPDPPLAVGAEARALMERARRWAAREGGDGDGAG